MKANTPVNQQRRNLTRSALGLLLSGLAGSAGRVLAATGTARMRLQEMPARPWADPASLVTAIAAGTVAVPKVADSVRAYVEALGYAEHWRGKISKEMSEFWGTPAMAGRAAAVVGPAGLKNGLVRFVELGDDYRSIRSHTTLGWAALEMRARDVDAMVEQLAGSPIVHTGGPADLNFGSGPATLRAVQFKGPTGEPLYFTQDFQFDRTPLIGNNNVGGIFLQTLAAVPYAETRDFYLQTMAMQLRVQASVPRVSVAEALGADTSRLYKMASIRAPQYCSIQVDEYPANKTPSRPTVPGCLPPGVCMSTLAVRDIDLLASALRTANIAYTEIDTNSIAPWTGARALACRGVSGEFIEFVEASA